LSHSRITPSLIANRLLVLPSISRIEYARLSSFNEKKPSPLPFAKGPLVSTKTPDIAQATYSRRFAKAGWLALQALLHKPLAENSLSITRRQNDISSLLFTP
jgi:hypothetical protein